MDSAGCEKVQKWLAEALVHLSSRFDRWPENPLNALETMIELNNKYALDGRNSNSYSGIFCVLGRYDGPRGPNVRSSARCVT